MNSSQSTVKLSLDQVLVSYSALENYNTKSQTKNDVLDILDVDSIQDTYNIQLDRTQTNTLLKAINNSLIAHESSPTDRLTSYTIKTKLQLINHDNFN